MNGDWLTVKVVIPRWKDRRTEGQKDRRTEGQKDRTYSAGVKDSASAYVLCPRLTEQLCLLIWKGVGSAEMDLEGFREGWEPERNAERRNDGI